MSRQQWVSHGLALHRSTLTNHFVRKTVVVWILRGSNWGLVIVSSRFRCLCRICLRRSRSWQFSRAWSHCAVDPLSTCIPSLLRPSLSLQMEEERNSSAKGAIMANYSASLQPFLAWIVDRFRAPGGGSFPEILRLIADKQLIIGAEWFIQTRLNDPWTVSLYIYMRIRRRSKLSEWCLFVYGSGAWLNKRWRLRI